MRRRLKTVNDVDEVSLDGRLFHTREAAAGNAPSPIVEWRIGGTMSVDVDSDLNRRLEYTSATLQSSLSRYGGAVKCCSTVVVAGRISSRRRQYPWTISDTYYVHLKDYTGAERDYESAL